MDAARMGPFMLRGMICLVLLLPACTSTETADLGDREVPLPTWVRELCIALERFKVASSLPEGTREPTATLVLDRVEGALRHLRSDMDRMGIPDVDDGVKIRDEIHAGLWQSAQSLAIARSRLSEIPDPDEQVKAFFDITFPVLAYPYALSALLSTPPSPPAPPPDVIVYLVDPVRRVTISGLTDELLARRGVERVEHETKAEACERFKELFAGQPALLENVDCEALPASLRVELSPNASADAIASVLKGQPGVGNVVVPDPLETEKRLEAIGLDVDALAPVSAEAEGQPACQLTPP